VEGAVAVSFEVKVFPADAYAGDAAAVIASALPRTGSVVITGGTTGANIYGAMTSSGSDWSGIEVFFSDERSVPPDHPASNFAMAKRKLFDPLGIEGWHRMRGEDDPEAAARAYHSELAGAGSAPELILLGMGGDAHIAALFPGSPALEGTTQLCRAVDRPDGMRGITLTPPALLAGRKIMLMVTGADKAEAVRRVLTDDEPPAAAPARLLAGHPDTAFLLDQAAASLL